jgi:hypothetical protein
MTNSFPMRLTLVLATVIGVVALPAARGSQQGPSQPGTTWTDEQLRQSGRTGAGQP